MFCTLSQIFNWIPEVYNDTKNLPTTMPKTLKNKIEAIDKNNRKEVIMALFANYHE